MAHGVTLGYRKAAHATNRGDRRVAGATPAKPLVHNRTAYRSGKCRCTVCKADHALGNREAKARRAAGGRTKQEEYADRLKEALPFLEDGCSYREVQATLGLDQKALARAFPEFRDNYIQWRFVWADIANDQAMHKLHREIWDMKL